MKALSESYSKVLKVHCVQYSTDNNIYLLNERANEIDGEYMKG